MKRTIILFLVFVIHTTFGFSQSIEHIDYISPFNEGFAAIKKDGQWAFINIKGVIVVDFRNDLVSTESSDGTYPIFKNDRCLIVEKKNGISYFGFINTTGENVIEPQFLNATNFNKENAIVLELIKENVGVNETLGKNVVYYKYLEAVIDVSGNVKYYLSPKRVNVILDKDFLREPPKIMSKLISDSLSATFNEDKTWTINLVGVVKN